MEKIKEIEDLAQVIYDKVMKFVSENKGEDDKYYNYAFLKLNDGRTIKVSFGEEQVLYIENVEYDGLWEELDVGDSVRIGPHWDTKEFDVEIEICHYAKENYSYPLSLIEKTQEEIKQETRIVLKYIVKLCEQTNYLTYDEELTHAVSNLNEESRKKYNIQIFNEEMQKLKETNPDSETLPSVETAVNWIIAEMIRIQKKLSKEIPNENQCETFRRSLSEKIMNELKSGETVRFRANSYKVKEALEEAGISFYSEGMYVKVVANNVEAGFYEQMSEIYSAEQQEDTKRRK